MTGLFHFSQDSSSNDVAAPPIYWPEGQSARSINDSARQMMAALANWYADNTDVIVGSGPTRGTITIATAQSVNLTKAFEFNFTVDDQNTGPVEMVVDGAPSRPLHRPGNIALGPGDLTPNVVYRARWVRVLGRYILVSPVPGVPGKIEMFGTETAIPKGWVVCDGRALSRTNYEALFGAIGTAHGSTSDTDFRVPDLRGRAPFGADAMGGSAAGRLNGDGGLNGAVGSTGGTATVTLTDGQMPTHKHTGSTGSGGAQPATTTGAGGAVAASTTGAGGAHSHTGSTETAGGHSHSGNTEVAGSHVHGQRYERQTIYDAGSALFAVTQLYPPGSNSTAQTEPAGEHGHSFTTDAVAGHAHGLTTDVVSAHSHSIPGAPDHTHSVPAVPAHSHTVSVDNAGGGGAHPNIPPGLVVVFAIKA